MQKHRYPSTKDAALHELGVVSEKNRKALASQVEFVQVRTGRQLLARGRFAPSVVIGVAGAALVTNGDGHVARLEAPFVIDTWVADDRRISETTVVADTPTTLVLVDWRNRDSVFANVPALAQLSHQTKDALEQSKKQHIDLTEESPQLQPAH